ncbi:TnsA endonuclease N-terminal domain-containing protein [Paraglaciecola aquimarina]|uniref:TnsA endonuclease N-terminal domain-containing protein n=1 Tax=Paraglaciecola aquimarina TaxID=1235557 RepID=A0ABU3SUR6_9ALTE|nr:TnsA endonuclease N-terminal domain-containing protein [Paraglaciecola aquimarina]MDU0353761.1 TnsA endonuclease N-terminal domain-containing protein [Paraglaciecola aquimarina]
MGRYDQNAKVYTKWLKGGRGQGRLENYKPWLQVYNVPSSGRSSRPWSAKIGRVVHCMSDLELSTFLLLEWSEAVVDIREQFPLDLTTTLQIAKTLGFRHPAVRGENIVMTTDFLVSMSSSTHPLLALQVKPSGELDKLRVREKLAIEEQYWKDLNVPFQIVTEHSHDQIKVENIKWFASCFSKLTSLEVLEQLADWWSPIMEQKGSMRLIQLCTDIDVQLNQEPGTSLGQIRLLCSKKVAQFDLSIPFFDILAGDIGFRKISGTKG